MISASDRSVALSLIKEATTAGARESVACKEIGLTLRTVQRWKSQHSPNEDQWPLADRPTPRNKLSQQEVDKVLKVVNSPQYQSLPPSQIVPSLADQGIYLASESTIYRILREQDMQHHRGRSNAPSKRLAATHCANGPNQVWMWDITWLPGPAKGLFYYLYLILDLYSRKIIAWEVYQQESAELASQLVRRASLSENLSASPNPLCVSIVVIGLDPKYSKDKRSQKGDDNHGTIQPRVQTLDYQEDDASK